MKVFVNGCFDVLHKGHFSMLQYASSLGQLSVALDTDEKVLSEAQFVEQEDSVRLELEEKASGNFQNLSSLMRSKILNSLFFNRNALKVLYDLILMHHIRKSVF